MITLLEYAEALVKPVEVLVISGEARISADIESALTVYNCCVMSLPNSSHLVKCLQAQAPELVFIGDDIKGPLDALSSVKLIASICPQASVVILTKTPGSEKVAALMKHGPYTFMVKNGSFSQAYVQRVFGQLNLRLRHSGRTVVDDNEVSLQQRVV